MKGCGDGAGDRLRKVLAAARFVDPVPRTIRFARDPSDEKFLNLCVAGGADFLVTHDHDFGSPELLGELRRVVPGLRVVDPVAFLRSVDPTDETGFSRF